MKPEQQRIAIAEARGYVRGPGGWRFDGEGFTSVNELPNYLNDLNAAHEMEKVLTFHQAGKYHTILCETVSRDMGKTCDGRHLIMATAAQRCEAFLRTLSLWQQ